MLNRHSTLFWFQLLLQLTLVPIFVVIASHHSGGWMLFFMIAALGAIFNAASLLKDI